MNNETIIIGISGPTASGKSLLANTIVNEIGSKQVVVISEDSYYSDISDMSYEERCAVNFDHPDAFDHGLMAKHLRQVQQQKPVDIPVYDFTQHMRSEETRRIGKHRIIILEGILLLYEASIRSLMDITIFMDTPLDICLIRRLKRDMVERGRSMESIMAQYRKTVRPMYFQFIEPSKRHADIIVPRGGENRIAIDLIKAKMNELLLDGHE